MSNRFSNIMIMSDIDGTFLGRAVTIVQRNVDAIERFKAEGGLFTFATGRTDANLFSAIPTAADIVNAPLSLSNGCCLYDAKSKTPIRNYFIKQGDGLEAALYLRRTYPDVGLRISNLAGFMYEPDDVVACNNVRRVDAEKKVPMPRDKWTDEDWYKVVMVGEPDQLEVIKTDCQKRYGDKFIFDRSGRNLLEIHDPTRSKAVMMDDFRQMYAKEGRDLKIYAVGDFENDIEMLTDADVAVCPANALDSVKAVCDHCFCRNTEGVIADLVEYLEKNIEK